MNMETVKNCYICNKGYAGVKKSRVNIFDSKTPISNKKIHELLLDMSGTVVQDENKQKNNLCGKCYKAILEYDYLLSRVNDIKKVICDNISQSKEIRINQEKIKQEEKSLKKKIQVVVPASKLKPLPPGFNFKLNNGLENTSFNKMFQDTFAVQDNTMQNLEYEESIILPDEVSSFLSKKQLNLDDYVVEGDDNNIDDQSMEIDDDAVIMEADNGMLSVVSHQNFLYGNSEISLVMPSGDGLDQNGDAQDSDTHIELQVSGDEETAKAIMAAANEQGGTFIKVENGEMYEVKSVESKMEYSQPTDDPFRLEGTMVEVFDDQFQCLFCKRNPKTEKPEPVLGDADWMMNHLKSVHSARLYLCNCGAVIRKRVDFAAHMEQHSNSKTRSLKFLGKMSKLHECSVCKKKFSSRLALSGHMNTHTGARPYTCELCDRCFASQYTQQAHMKTHTDRPRPFKCKQCGKAFFTPHNLQHHEKIHMGTKDFVCKDCGKAFGSQHNLEVHSVVHSGVKPFVCSVCNKAFARRAEVKDHMRIHTGERPFECEICGAKFSQRSNLHSHRRATHLQDKRHECPHCSKRFKRRRLLEYHIKSFHTGERPLQCDVCDATFIYPEHHKKHMRIHSGERPFTCEVCGKGFNSRDNRNVHRFIHSDRKPFECVLCGAGYMRKNRLYQHMNTAGHLSESIVVNQPRVIQVEDEESKLQSVIISADSENQKILDTVYEDLVPNEIDTQDTAPAQYILSSGSKSIQLVQENETEVEDCALLGIDNADTETQINGRILENLTPEQIEQLEQTHILSEGNRTVRVIQIQLADGGYGWVAVTE